MNHSDNLRTSKSLLVSTILLTVLVVFPKPQIAPKAITVADMTLSEKVGQLMMVHVRGTKADTDARKLIQDLHIGGIIYYNWANELTSPEQVQVLSAGLQQLANHTRLQIPLLIAADQEGGRVERCPITKFPGNKALGLTNDPDLAETSAHVIGAELAAIGVNTNLAPVVDVNCNPLNSVIGTRAYGDTAEIVLKFATRALSGYHAANTITTLKHFPGHGDTETDSHCALPVINKSLAQLQAVELAPFAQLAQKTDIIMTSHLLVPALDSEHCVTLSCKAIDYLRHQIGFNGVIMTDSLIMAGVLKQVAESPDEAAIQALIAGHDIVLLGGAQLHGANIAKELTLADIQRIHGALITAVAAGRISVMQIDRSVQRVLDLKVQYLYQHNISTGELKNQVNTPASRDLAQKISRARLKNT